MHYPKTRKEAWGMPCPYCNKKMGREHRRMPTRDHLYPKSRGGELGEGNAVIVCERCNSHKSSRTIVEFHDWLVEQKDPRAEHVAHFIKIKRMTMPTMFVARFIEGRYSRPNRRDEPLGWAWD